MKYLKILSLAAVAATALMAFASSASATVLTSPKGTVLPAGTTIEATLKAGTSASLLGGGFTLDTCTKASVTGKTSNTGSATETVSGTLAKENIKWESCTHPTTTLTGGSLEIHVIGSGPNGTLTAKGVEVHIAETPVGTCVYRAPSTGLDLGTLTGSSSTGSTAVMDINAKVPKNSTLSGAFCPAEGEWKGEYVVTNPDFLDVS